jgi:2-oxo-4-hydroxy-4-carboxy-5-ureidoimidazoline decarboxylase
MALTMPTLASLNGAAQPAFTAALGGVFEHSPWVAARAWAARPFASVDALHQAMVAAVRAASDGERLALLRAHPDLAGKAARAGAVTASSVAEQASAGLDRLTDEELARFEALNAAHRARFGFPFIIAVRRHDKAGILREFARRVAHTEAEEVDAALAEVFAIARMRLDALVRA